MVLGTGVVLGALRVPIRVPRIGERWAELAEMPITSMVMFLAAGLVLRRNTSVRFPPRSLAAGVVGLALMIAAKLAMATVPQEQTLTAIMIVRDRVSRLVSMGILLVSAVMPRIRLTRAKGHACKATQQ